MKKVLLLICVALLCMNVSGADDFVEILPSSNVANPEHCYKVHCGRQNQTYYWSFKGGAVNDRNIGAFCFIPKESTSEEESTVLDTKDYYIFSVSEGKFVTYDPAGLTQGTRDLATYTDDKSKAQAWRFNKILAEGNNYYEIQPYAADGSVSKWYVNWFQGLDGYNHLSLGIWEHDGTKDKGSTWTVEEVNVVPVKYNYKTGDHLVRSIDTKQIVGELYASPDMYLASSSDYYTFTQPEGTASAEASSVDVQFTQDLPFEVSTSQADAKWYTLSINTTGKKLHYTKGDTKMTLSRTNTYCDDYEYFCFVGNVFDGFYIYNKAAGADMQLSSTYNTYDNYNGAHTYAVMTDKTTANNQANRWAITKAADSNSFYISQDEHTRNHLADRDDVLCYTNENTRPNELSAVNAFSVKSQADEEMDFYNRLQSMAVAEVSDDATVADPIEFGDDYTAKEIYDAHNGIKDYDLANSTYDEAKAFFGNYNIDLLRSYLKLYDQQGGVAPSVVDYTMKIEWGTLILPFSSKIPEGLNLYSCASLTGTRLDLAEQTQQITKQTPYIIGAPNLVAPTNYQFVGYEDANATTDPKTVGYLTGVLGAGSYIPQGSYILSKKDNVIGFYKVAESNAKLAGQYKCYLTVPTSAASSAAFQFPSFDDITGIDSATTVTVHTSSGTIYDLQGNKVAYPQKGGIYVVNGKLVKMSK